MYHSPDESKATRKARQRRAEAQADVDEELGYTSARYNAVERALPRRINEHGRKGVRIGPGGQDPGMVYEGLIETLARSRVPIRHLLTLKGGITVNQGGPPPGSRRGKSGDYLPEMRGDDRSQNRPASINVFMSGRSYQKSPAQQRSIVHELGHHATIRQIEVDPDRGNKPKDFYEWGTAEALADNYASLHYVPPQGARVPGSYYEDIVSNYQAHPDFGINYEATRDPGLRAPIGVMDAPDAPLEVIGRRDRSERTRVTRQAGQPRASRRRKKERE